VVEAQAVDFADEQRFESLMSRARAVVAALVATGIADVVAVIFDWNRYELLGRIESGAGVSLSEANASDHRQAVMGLVQVALFLVTAVLFIRWFRRAYLNVDALGGERRFGAGWAIGAWFVPVVNLWRPKQIANDLWRTSEPGVLRLERGSPLLAWWWGTFLVSSWLDGRAALASGSTAHELRSSAVVYLASDALDVVAVVLAVAVVLTLTRRQEERRRQLDAGRSQ